MRRGRAAAPPRRRRRPPCPGARRCSALTSAPGSISGARLVFTSSAVGFMRARSSAVTMPRVASTRRMCSETTSHSLEERLLARARPQAVRARPLARCVARPDQDLHAERLAVPGDHARRSGRSRRCRASCRAGCGRRRSANCPALSAAICCGICAHGGQHQPPGQLGRRIRRRAGMLARRHDDAAPRAGLDVDMRIARCAG